LLSSEVLSEPRNRSRSARQQRFLQVARPEAREVIDPEAHPANIQAAAVALTGAGQSTKLDPIQDRPEEERRAHGDMDSAWALVQIAVIDGEGRVMGIEQEAAG
jgi:hypothetical protein